VIRHRHPFESRASPVEDIGVTNATHLRRLKT
jgi:hypothetical protein